MTTSHVESSAGSLFVSDSELELSLERFMLSLTAASEELLAPSLTTGPGTSVADAGIAGSTEGVGAELDDAASAGRFGGAVSVVGSGTSALLSSWFSANRTLFNARVMGEHRPLVWLRREDGFPLLCLPDFSFNANSTFFGEALCTATTDQCYLSA